MEWPNSKLITHNSKLRPSGRSSSLTAHLLHHLLLHLLLAHLLHEALSDLGREVLQDLDRLLAALRAELDELKRQAQDENTPPGEQLGGAGADAGQRLVSVMAELLMLRELQEDVNRQTRRMEDLREAQREGGPGEVWDRALERLSQKQGSISTMTSKIAEDFQAARQAIQGEPGEGNPEPRVEGEE